MDNLADDLDVASGTCCKKSVPSVSIGKGEIGASREEEVKERDVSCPARDQERSETVGVSAVDVGSTGEEVLDGFEVSKATRFCQTRIV